MSLSETELLAWVLAERDALCPVCRYQLRGLTQATCPECGEALRIEVGAVEPRMGAFIAGLIGLATGTGFAAIVLAWALWMLLGRSWGPDWLPLFLASTQVVVEGALLTALIVKRRWFRRRTAGIRWTLALLTFLLTAIMSGLFIATAN